LEDCGKHSILLRVLGGVFPSLNIVDVGPWLFSFTEDLGTRLKGDKLDLGCNASY
jgi:hypothetical protein